MYVYEMSNILILSPSVFKEGSSESVHMRSLRICTDSLEPSLVAFTIYGYREHSGSVVECLTRDRGLRGRASPASLPCVLEHDTLILA